MAKGKLRAKIPELRRALQGNFQPHHALIISQILAHLDHLEEIIAALTEEIEARLVPFERKAERLRPIPGVAERNSQRSSPSSART